MVQVLKKFIGRFVVAYFDEILIYSQDKNQHLKLLAEEFQFLYDNQLYINLKKCCFD